MRNKISAIIIDKDKNSHDYDSVRFENLPDWCEKGFIISVYESAEKIKSILNLNRGFDCLVSVGDLPQSDFDTLNSLPFEIRKKWCHCDEFNPGNIAYKIVNTLLYNINRENGNGAKLFSVFTCAFNTPKDVITRLYESLCKQTYTNWNWWILDDSTNSNVANYFEKLHDIRVTVIKNITNHGNIGFNKHLIAMACNGDYLVEVDHDDELTPDCLEKLAECYALSDADFVYSDCLELIDNKPIWYGKTFSFGQGYYRDEEVNGVKYENVAITCSNINIKSIRGIYACPNHVRTWKKEFYHKIGGHNTELSVMDDLDIIIRTFLYGKMAKVNKVLYIQNQGVSQSNGRGETATGSRLNEIQRMNLLIKWKYEKEIHSRILELGVEDTVWNEETEESDVRKETKELVPMDCLIIE